VPSQAAEAERCRSILVELLLPFAGDAATRADRLLDEYASLGAALAAPLPVLARLLGGDAAAARHLGLVREAMLEVLRPQALGGPILSNSRELLDYLCAGMAHLPSEHLRVLFLNAQNRLLADETVSLGTARELGATALILAHNHPSGDPQPSAGDVAATRRLREVGAILDVEIHDHLVVARSGCASLRALGYL
jgi:DNA repair protein RadC